MNKKHKQIPNTTAHMSWIFWGAMLVLFSLTFKTGEALTQWSNYLGDGRLNYDTIKYCHLGSFYDAEARFAASEWDITTTKPTITNDCDNAGLKSFSPSLPEALPLGYAVYCPAFLPCINPYVDKEAPPPEHWDRNALVSEAHLNRHPQALGGVGTTTDQRRHTYLHEMGHAIALLAHREEDNAVMRQGKLSIITPNDLEIQLVENKW